MRELYMEAWKVNVVSFERLILYLDLAFILPVTGFSVIQGYFVYNLKFDSIWWFLKKQSH